MPCVTHAGYGVDLSHKTSLLSLSDLHHGYLYRCIFGGEFDVVVRIARTLPETSKFYHSSFVFCLRFFLIYVLYLIPSILNFKNKLCELLAGLSRSI